MNRTYDVFVDNGLFVLAYYLDKEIENITEQDIFDSIDMMCEKINEFTRCEKYSNLKSMMFANSALTQPNSSKKVNDFLNDFYNSIITLYQRLYSLCGNVPTLFIKKCGNVPTTSIKKKFYVFI